ncbi:hypothetical protein HY642_06325, partial [Candidatus Woesearchaeota archaeon]|nr:hypothetical protein [Candidatus Woesearchaeota archaeon]
MRKAALISIILVAVVLLAVPASAFSLLDWFKSLFAPAEQRITGAQVAGCVEPPSGMVSWWPGDNNANDIQDGNTGTLRNGATFAAGRVGQGFSLDGVDDFVSVQHNANLDGSGG